MEHIILVSFYSSAIEKIKNLHNYVTMKNDRVMNKK